MTGGWWRGGVGRQGGPRSARKPPFGANNRGAVPPRSKQPVLYLLKRWRSRGCIDSKFAQRIPRPIDLGFSERPLRGIDRRSVTETEHSASKPVLPSRPPERRPVTERARREYAEGVARAIGRAPAVPGAAPDLVVHRLDFSGVHRTGLGVHLVPILAFFRFLRSPWADLGVRRCPRPAITASWLFRRRCLAPGVHISWATLRERPATR